MKKLLAVLGATSLIASTGATVVACGPLNQENKPDLSHFNNSLPNMQGAASSWAKQLILSDQHHLSIAAMSNSLGTLKAQDVVKANTGLDFDANDFNLKPDSDLADLSEQYFGVGVKTGDINLIGEDIDLTGTIGENQDQLWKFLKDKLGVDLGGTTDLISGIVGSVLPTLNSGLLVDLIGQFLPGLGNTLKDLLNQAGINEKMIELISIVCDQMFTNEKFISEIGAMIDAFDISKTFAELKVEDLTSVAMISLSNAIGLFVDENYQIEEFKPEEVTDSSQIQAKVSQSGINFGKSIGKLIFPASDSEKPFSIDTFINTDLEKNITRYVTAIANLFQFLEFIQVQFSLFDDVKVVTPIDANHLFDEKITNKEYLQKKLGEGITLSQVTTDDTKGSLNLKYLLSIVKNAFNDLSNKDDLNGYSLQKFLTILLMGTQNVDLNDWNSDMTSPFASWTSEVAMQILVSFLSNSLGIKDKGIKFLPMLLKPTLQRFLTTFLEQLLSGGKLGDPVNYLIDDLINLLTTIKGFLPGDIKAIVEQIIKHENIIVPLIKGLFSKLPLLNANNGFKEFYSGDPLKMKDFIKEVEAIKKTIDIFVPSLTPTFESIIATLNDFSDSMNNFLPSGKQLNIKNILTTPLNQINNKSIIPPAFGGYYLNKSIVEIIDEICGKLKVDGKEKLLELPSNFNFKLSYLKDIFEMIVHYNYEWEGMPDGYLGKNLISIILENLDQVSAILGLKNDGSFGDNSLLDLIFNKILEVDNINKPDVDNDPFLFFAILLSSIFNNLNEPNIDNSEAFKKLFFAENTFKFDFQTPIIDDDGAFLGQMIVVNYHNSENNSDWVYTLNYSREKVSDIFQLASLKKVIYEPK